MFKIILLLIYTVIIILTPTTTHAKNSQYNGHDFIAYEKLVLSPRIEHQIPDYHQWYDTALGYVVAWMEFQEKFPKSSLIPQTNIRIAEWYLTIHKEDVISSGPIDEKQSGKYVPENLHQYYRMLALSYLNKSIKDHPNHLHYSHLGEKRFGYNNDTIGSFGLYTRAIFFPNTRKRDVCELKEKFADTPSAEEAERDFKTLWEKCGPAKDAK